jgi:hypothetical protein
MFDGDPPRRSPHMGGVCGVWTRLKAVQSLCVSPSSCWDKSQATPRHVLWGWVTVGGLCSWPLGARSRGVWGASPSASDWPGRWWCLPSTVNGLCPQKSRLAYPGWQFWRNGARIFQTRGVLSRLRASVVAELPAGPALPAAAEREG